MDAKNMGEQLAIDVIEIVERHHIVSEVISERMFEVFEKAKKVLELESDKDAIVESAVAEFRSTFAEALDRVFEDCKDMDDED